jgi:hypothetical protein
MNRTTDILCFVTVAAPVDDRDSRYCPRSVFMLSGLVDAYDFSTFQLKANEYGFLSVDKYGMP